jgi:small GTP-binding protein
MSKESNNPNSADAYQRGIERLKSIFKNDSHSSTSGRRQSLISSTSSPLNSYPSGRRQSMPVIQPKNKRKERYDVTFLGEMGVGKTTIVNKMCNKDFEPSAIYTPTVSNIFEVDMNLQDKDYKIRVLDTRGINCHDNSQVPNDYILEKQGFIVVYDVTNYRSFENAKDLCKRLIDDELIDPNNHPVLLVGNKTDQRAAKEEEHARKLESSTHNSYDDDYDDEVAVVPEAEVEEFFEDYYAYDYFSPMFCSAKKYDDVLAVFNKLVTQMQEVASQSG